MSLEILGIVVTLVSVAIGVILGLLLCKFLDDIFTMKGKE